MSKFAWLLISALRDREGRDSRDVSVDGDEGKRREFRPAEPARYKGHNTLLGIIVFDS